jgi:hypothetical protein
LNKDEWGIIRNRRFGCVEPIAYIDQETSQTEVKTNAQGDILPLSSGAQRKE